MFAGNEAFLKIVVKFLSVKNLCWKLLGLWPKVLKVSIPTALARIHLAI